MIERRKEIEPTSSLRIGRSTVARAEKIRTLEARLAVLRQQQQAAEQRARAASSKAERALDTRRKVLAGAFLLDALGSSEAAAAFRVNGVALVEWLRPADRALFLPPPALAGEGSAEPASSADSAATAGAAGVSR